MVVAVSPRVPFVAEIWDEFLPIVERRERILHAVPVRVQLGEPGLVVVDDRAERLAVGRDVRPEGVTGHGGEVELLPRERQCPLQAAVPVADATVVVDVSPKELILHRGLLIVVSAEGLGHS